MIPGVPTKVLVNSALMEARSFGLYIGGCLFLWRMEYLYLCVILNKDKDD